MSKKRTTYSAKRKAEIALAAIRERETQAQIASQHEVHPTQLKSWKQQALVAIEQEMLAIRSLNTNGQIIKDVYVSETRRLYAKAQTVKNSQSE